MRPPTGSEASAIPKGDGGTAPGGLQTLTTLALILLVAAFLRLYRLESVPPGLYHDEIFNGLDAQEVLRGRLALYFEANQGRHGLLIYLQALTIALLGNTPLAVRLPSALVGTATVVALFFLAQELCPEPRERRRYALLAATILAGLQWHVTFSREGFAAILTPLVEIPTLLFLWRGVRGRGFGNYLWAGLFLGVGLYAYTLLYLLPLVLLLWGLYLLWSEGQRALGKVKGFAAAGVLALGLFVPLGSYFLQQPGLVFSRPAYVAFTNPELSATSPFFGLAENAGKALGMFLWAGDTNWRHNIAGRPLLDPLTQVLFFLGLGACLYRFREPEKALLLILCAVMITPTILASEGAPHSRRILGMLPAVVLLAAQGMLLALHLLERGLRHLFAPRGSLSLISGPGALMVAALAIGVPTFINYFLVWAPHPRTAEAFETEDWEAARSLVSAVRSPGEAGSAQRIYGPSNDYFRRILTFLTTQQPPVTVQDDRRYLVFPEAESGAALYVMSQAASKGDRYLAEHFGAYALQIPQPPLPGLAEASYRLPPQALRFLPPPQGSQALGLGLENGVHLERYLLGRQVRAGESLELTLLWRVTQVPEGDYRFFHHLVDAQGRVWGTWDGVGHRPRDWQRGDRVLSWHSIPVATDTPTGLYWLELGMYEVPTLRRVPLLPDSRLAQSDRLRLGPLKVAALPRTDLALRERRVTFGQTLQLLGYRLERASVTEGEELRLHLSWRALGRVERDYTVFVHVQDAVGRLLAQADAYPSRGNYPTSAWEPGETVEDEHLLRLPPAKVAERVRVTVGFYLLETMERLPITQGARPGESDAAVLEDLSPGP